MPRANPLMADPFRFGMHGCDRSPLAATFARHSLGRAGLFASLDTIRRILIVDNTRIMHARGRVDDFSPRATYRVPLSVAGIGDDQL
jgi:hypothetical protein